MSKTVSNFNTPSFPLDGSELIGMVQDGDNRKLSIDQLTSYMVPQLELVTFDNVVADIDSLAAVPFPINNQPMFVAQKGRGGYFFFSSADLSAQVASDPLRGIYVPPVGQDGSLGAWVREFDGPLQSNWWGAKTNDSTFDNGPALAAMSAILNLMGGGAISLEPGAVYWIGAQTLNGAAPPQAGGGVYTFAPNIGNPIEINGCTRPVIIYCNGATIKCRPALKYGSFNEDGTPRADASPFYGAAGVAGFNLATPYAAMVYIHDCTGPVQIIGGLELDGNIGAQNIGGVWGNAGRQIPMSGLMLNDNIGPIDVSSIYSHHHGLDGGIGNGPGVLNVVEHVHIRTSKFLNNGRQGFSLTGGNGWAFETCKFNETGKDLGVSMIYSPPGAGVDLEAEGGRWVRNITFETCEFADNPNGAGLLSDTNAFVKDVTCRNCQFIGTENWSIWPYNPGFVFEDCLIAGAFTRAYASADPNLATQFRRCLITDDVAQSSTGATYGGGTGGVHFDTGGGIQNIRFEECVWEKTKAGVSSAAGSQPSSIADAALWFHHCTFVRRAGATGSFWVAGIMSGERSSITDMDSAPAPQAAAFGLFPYLLALDSWNYTSTAVPANSGRYPANYDKVTAKGIFVGSATYDPPSLATGAKDTIQTMTVTGVALGDKVTGVSFSNDLAGCRIVAWVSAANTVSFYAINENGANPVDLASGTVRVTVTQK